MQKIAVYALSHIFATTARIDNRKKTCYTAISPPHVLKYGERRPRSLGHPSKFQWVLGLGFITAPMSLNGGQPNFAQCLAVSWAGTLYIHFLGLLPLTEFC